MRRDAEHTACESNHQAPLAPLKEPAMGLIYGFVDPSPNSARRRLEAFITAMEAGSYVVNVRSGGNSQEEPEEQHITPFDMLCLPGDIKKDVFAELFVKKLGLNEFKEDRSELMDKIFDCLRLASRVVQEELHIAMPQEMLNLLEGANAKNFWKIIKGAQPGTRKAYISRYCMLLSFAYAIWESQRKELESLKDDTEFVYEKLFTLEYRGQKRIHKLGIEDEKGWQKIGINTMEGDYVEAHIQRRGKNNLRTWLKLVRSPGQSTETIMKDGIGFRLRFKDDNGRTASGNARKTLLFFAGFLEGTFGGRDQFFENRGTLDTEDEKRLCGAFEAADINVKPDGKPNKSSSREFATAKIRGTLDVTRTTRGFTTKNERSYEVQAVLDGNRNDRGFTSPEFYQYVQILEVVSRAQGYFSEEYLELICKAAERETGMKMEKGKEHIITKHLARIKPKVDGAKYRYIFKSQLDRLRAANLLPSGLHVDTRRPNS